MPVPLVTAEPVLVVDQVTTCRGMMGRVFQSAGQVKYPMLQVCVSLVTHPVVAAMVLVITSVSPVLKTRHLTF